MPSLVLGGVTDLDQDKILKDTIIASNLSKSDTQELRNTMDTTADLRESNVIDLQQVTQCDVDSFVGENNSSSTLFRNDCSRYSMDSNLNGGVPILFPKAVTERTTIEMHLTKVYGSTVLSLNLQLMT